MLQDLVDCIINDELKKNQYFGNFLDTVKRVEMVDLFNTKPDFKSLPDYEKSYIVAMCHKLLNDNGLEVPKWIKSKEFVLDEPHFAVKTETKLKLYLLYESPVEFKMRNIFVTANVLERV